MTKSLAAFQGYGIEIEYMIVSDKTLDVAHEVEFLLTTQNNGLLENEIEVGELCWSNELVSHVLEFKCNGPTASIDRLDQKFHQSVLLANKLLAAKNCRLMPTAMHPWMLPARDMVLWPHGQQDIYQKYDSIFNCQGHGWCNLQSVHINLPFGSEKEFGHLLAAIRLLMPLVPFVAASSPLVEMQLQPKPDLRLLFYEKNQARIPSITGSVIPEELYDFSSYQNLLQGLYRDIGPFDSQGLLQHQWLNSRGAIAKFDVSAIEIRIVDSQESPYMDFALIHFFVAVIKNLFAQKWSSFEQQKIIPTTLLKGIYDSANTFDNPIIINSNYLQLFSLPSATKKMSFQEFFQHLYSLVQNDIPAYYRPGLEVLQKRGSLSQRIKGALGKMNLEQQIPIVYRQLCQTLDNNGIFGG